MKFAIVSVLLFVAVVGVHSAPKGGPISADADVDASIWPDIDLPGFDFGGDGSEDGGDGQTIRHHIEIKFGGDGDEGGSNGDGATKHHIKNGHHTSHVGADVDAHVGANIQIPEISLTNALDSVNKILRTIFSNDLSDVITEVLGNALRGKSIVQPLNKLKSILQRVLGKNGVIPGVGGLLNGLITPKNRDAKIDEAIKKIRNALGALGNKKIVDTIVNLIESLAKGGTIQGIIDSVTGALDKLHGIVGGIGKISNHF